MNPRDQELWDKSMDLALRRYGDAEPRAGLEGRVLANLRAEREKPQARPWRWQPVAAILASALVIGVGVLVWQRSSAGKKDLALQSSPHLAVNAASASSAAPAQVVPNPRIASQPIRRRSKAETFAVATEKVPHLERFPSPQPLSAQEQMLARYVEEHPEEAKQMARAQTALLQQELLEFEKQDESQSPSGDSPQ